MSNPSESSTNDNESEHEPGYPMWLFGLSGMALLWNLVGLAVFIAQVSLDPEQLLSNQNPTTPEQVASAEAELAMYKAMPVWVLVAFGTATIGGTLGCLMMLIRSRHAIWLFAVSLVALLFQQYYMFFGSDMLKLPGASVGFPLSILAIAVMLLGIAVFARRENWLK